MQGDDKWTLVARGFFFPSCGNVRLMVVACYTVMNNLLRFLKTFLKCMICFCTEEFSYLYFVRWEEIQKEIITDMVPGQEVFSWFIDQACEDSPGPEVLWCLGLLLEDSIWSNFYLQQRKTLFTYFNKVPAIQSACEQHAYKVYPCPWTCIIWSKVRVELD